MGPGCVCKSVKVLSNTQTNSCHADEQHGIELLEVYCNPNAHATAFDAKTLITLKTSQGVRVTAEARLSALKSDLDTFLEPK